MRTENKRKLFGGSCFFGLLSLTLAILSIELFDTSRRVDKLLLSGIERMAVRTNINVNIFYGGMDLDLIPTRTPCFGLEVFWVDIRLHEVLTMSS